MFVVLPETGEVGAALKNEGATWSLHDPLTIIGHYPKERGHVTQVLVFVSRPKVSNPEK